MKDTIKKYITDSKELKVAEELIDKFVSSAGVRNNAVAYKVKSIEAENFGIVGNVKVSLSDMVAIAGNRGSGKSLFMETFPWVVTGKCRTIADVAGDISKPVRVSYKLEIKDKVYTLQRIRKKSTNTVELICDNNAIAKGNDGVMMELGKLLKFDLRLLLDTYYYSPRLSFQFAREQSAPVEEHIIKLTNLNTWLELQQFVKDTKKEEKEKLDNIDGIIGYISAQSETKEEVQQKINNLNAEKDETQKEIDKIKEPNATEIKNKIDAIKDKINKVVELESKLEINGSVDGKREKILNIEESIVKLKARIEEIGDVKTLLAKSNSVLGDIKYKGESARNEMDSRKDMIKTLECPVLKKKCDELVAYKDKIEPEIEKFEKQRIDLLKDYNKEKENNDKITALSEEKVKIESELEALNNSKKEIEEELKSYDSIDAEKISKQLEEFPKREKLMKELADSEKKYEGVVDLIQNAKDEKEKLRANIIEADADIKRYNEQLEEFDKYQKYLKDKNKYETRQAIFDSLIDLFGKKQLPKIEASKKIKELNKNMNLVLDKLSNKTLEVDINENFEMNIKSSDSDKFIKAQLICDAYEHLVNLSFSIACCLLISKKIIKKTKKPEINVITNEIPVMFIDEVFLANPREERQNIINGIEGLYLDHKIGQVIFCSNRMEKKLINDDMQYIEFKGGGLK